MVLRERIIAIATIEIVLTLAGLLVSQSKEFLKGKGDLKNE